MGSSFSVYSDQLGISNVFQSKNSTKSKKAIEL